MKKSGLDSDKSQDVEDPHLNLSLNQQVILPS